MAKTSDCTSCKDARREKGLPPAVKIKLPPGVTPSKSFKRPRLATWVCPYCDGETLINSALLNLEKRQAE